MEQFKGFVRRADWEAKYRAAMSQHVINLADGSAQYLLAIPARAQLELMLKRLFDESEFLSPFGIRSLSKVYQAAPYRLPGAMASPIASTMNPGRAPATCSGATPTGAGRSGFPMNYLILESLRVYHKFYQDGLLVEFPTGSGNRMTLGEAARQLSHRLQNLFLPDLAGPAVPATATTTATATSRTGGTCCSSTSTTTPRRGRGCGASHQTGWTALIADLLNLEVRWTAPAAPTDRSRSHESGQQGSRRPRPHPVRVRCRTWPITNVLVGQPALVTGANSGIGRAVALGLARAGADVVVNYVTDPTAAEEVANEIVRMGRRAIALKADVSKEDEVLEPVRAGDRSTSEPCISWSAMPVCSATPLSIR